MTRRLYIDALRGVAVVLMIMWHAVDAWTLPSSRDGAAFAVITFLAGWVAPMFLFLAGVAVPLAGAARIARGASRRQAGWSLQKRGWEIFLIAHLFRLQSFLLNPNGQWASILKPDILNILGLGMVAAAFIWSRSRDLRSLTWRLLVPTAFMLFVLTPWSRHWWWPTLLHPRLEAYVRPVGNLGQFTLFPTIGYLLAGTLIGAMVAASDPKDLRAQARVALAGVGALVLGLVLTPVATSMTSWGDSAALFVSRAGTITLLLPITWGLARRLEPGGWNPLVVFGQTSLFVYWVHVELVYGVFSYPLKRSLPLSVSFPAYLLFTGAMLAAAKAWQRRSYGPLIPAHMRATGAVSGS
jgi:uncharacterized membrane protein